MPDSWGPFTQAYLCDIFDTGKPVCNPTGVSFTESTCADAKRCRAGPVLWKTARLPVLQIHAGGWREGHVWVLQVNIKPVFLFVVRCIQRKQKRLIKQPVSIYYFM